MDVDRYLSRIGVAAGGPDLETLQTIVTGHIRSIAFENLDALTGAEPALDPAGLAAKLIDGGRGGWCFEQNGLLRDALTALGYEVTGLAARVRYGRPPDAPPTPRSHMALLVSGLPGGPHVVDVGFGGGTPTGVIRLVPDVEQETPNEPCRLTRDGDAYVMEVRLGAWAPLYAFDLTPQLPADYGVSNFYLSHHPESHFRHGLMVARAEPGVRYGLGNTRLSTYRLGEPGEQRDLATVAELREVLTGTFGIDLEGVRGLDDRLGQLLRR